MTTRPPLRSAEIAERDDFRQDVLDGLAAPQKRIPPKYFYDDAGSALFDRICDLPEYYPTRTEQSILDGHAAAMADALGAGVLLIEPGAGSGRKTRTLLRALQAPAAYVPIDISGAHLLASAEALRAEFPALRVVPVVADFTAAFSLPASLEVGVRRAVFFPGSTLGNFEPLPARALLAGFRRLAGRDGQLLLGVDLQKDPAILQRAYDDAAGVTAQFNLNLLTRINRELAGQFDPQRFGHRALYNAALQRIEMHLVSQCDQVVRVAGQPFRFRRGETIHTENSYKYTPASLAALAGEAGWRVRHRWLDAQGGFGLFLLAPKG